MSSEQTQKYRLGYSQSVNGIVSFSGSVHFDDIKDVRLEILNILYTLQEAEKTFSNADYQLAKNNKPIPKTKTK